jgi:hypothetical protein
MHIYKLENKVNGKKHNSETKEKMSYARLKYYGKVT